MNVTKHKMRLGFLLLILLVINTSSQQDVKAEDKTSDSLLNAYQQSKSDREAILNLVRLSDYYMYRNSKSTIYYALEAIKRAEQSEEKELVPVALFIAGNAHFSTGFLEEAADYYYRSLRLSSPDADPMRVLGLMANISSIKLKLEDYEGALEVLKESLVYFNSNIGEIGLVNENYDHIHSIYNNIGLIYQNLGSYELAIEYLKEGITLAKASKVGMLQLGTLLNNLGKTYQQTGDTSLAYSYLMESLRVRESTGDVAGIMKSCLNLADYFNFLNQQSKRLAYLNRGYALAVEHQYDVQIWEVASNLAVLYEEASEKDSALKYYSIHKQFEEQIALQNMDNELLKHEIQYKLFEEELKFELKKKQSFIQWMLVIAVLFIVLSFIYYYYYQHQTKVRLIALENNNKLQELDNVRMQNKLMEKQLETGHKAIEDNVKFQHKKNELINQIIEKLAVYAINLNEDQKEVLRALIRKLEQAGEDYTWDEFEKVFGEVNAEFYEKLNILFGDLTQNEKRLCAFLYLGMSKSEISELTLKTVESIDIAILRLKKKMSLDQSQTDLHQFLKSL